MLYKLLQNDEGNILIFSVLILLLLTLLGVFAANNSSIELAISGNDKISKKTFYQADGGTQVGVELLEQNIESVGFSNTQIGDIVVDPNHLNFYLEDNSSTISDANRTAYFPSNYTPNQPHTNLVIGGNPVLSTGNALQLAAGYEGKGKSSAGGGVYMIYDIYSQHIGESNSRSTIKIRYKFMP